MDGDWLIQTLCMMGSVIGLALLVSMIRRDGDNELRGFYRGRLRKRKIKHAKPVAAVAMA